MNSFGFFIIFCLLFHSFSNFTIILKNKLGLVNFFVFENRMLKYGEHIQGKVKKKINNNY